METNEYALSLALAVVAHAWISKIIAPQPIINIVAWVVSVALTVMFLLRVIKIG